ncbi:unnamed protein product [Caenorhabditis auriculariae]|uniref:Cullin-5 n=1 Tax=Caenorhabditis auriculariae TaxID=2777116 RepID=A0A8S1HM68_9PELO|nr:unnamed protein product [Caenorhabditis auriculariae]
MHGSLRAESGLNFETEWARAHPTVLALLNQTRVTPTEWQDLFLSVYKIHSWVEDGEEKVREALSEDIVRYVAEAEKRIRVYEGTSSLLRVYINEWARFYKQANILPLPFKVIESAYGKTAKTIDLVPIKTVMLEKWNTAIFSSFSQQLLSAAMGLVESERNGGIIDSQLVIGVRESFVALNDAPDDPLALYRRTFEKVFTEETVNYYKNRNSQYLEEHGVLEYMIYADRKLDEENLRASKYLDSSYPASTSHGNDEARLKAPNVMTQYSIKKHMDCCVMVLVEEYEESILGECSRLIQNRDVERLQRLYRLIRRTRKGIETVVKCIDEHIRTEGLNDMHANAETITADPEKYVAQLLNMFEKFSALVRDGFCDDARLLTTRDKAFREVVNDCSIFRLELLNKKGKTSSVESKCAELLANYCDLLLRKTQLSKKLTSEEIDEKLNQVLLVLKYVQNKDLFMRFHRAHLSRRLILEMSADQDKEEMMVNKLRECGMPPDMVNKLSKMLQDIEVNKDLSSLFKQSLSINNNKMADVVNIKILNGGAWGRGGSDKVRVSLPRELDEFVPEIEGFYKKQHSGRKLAWMHHWSSGTMVFGTSSGGRFDLEVTTFQMAVLFCWNDRANEKLSLESLRIATELPDTELFRTLLSLVACPKIKSQVLNCDLPGPNINPRDFNDSTLFFVNHDFNLSKNGKAQLRGKVNLIGRLQLSLEPNAEKEHESIVALREYRVQEAIVKVLKTRKSITLAQLTTELIEILKPFFLPNRKMIKEQIDWLIENKYMERRPDDINTFVYLS